MTNPKASSNPNPGARSRFAPDPRNGLRLEPRDEELLLTLYQHAAMARGQIQTLFFGSVPRCNARLRQLFDWDFVIRYFPPRSRWGAEAVYLPGKAAVPLIAARLELEEPDVRKQCRTRTPTFLEHTLAIVDFYLALRTAVSEAPTIEIETWLPEMLCRHEYDLRAPGGAWRKEAFKPDAFVRLGIGDPPEYRSFFVEIDLGHTSSGQFLGKLDGHLRYLQSGLFAETFDCDRFATLVVTTTPARLQNLQSLAAERRSDLFWFTTFAQIEKAGGLAPIWQRSGQTAKVGLDGSSDPTV
jgi:hypothetical protein